MIRALFITIPLLSLALVVNGYLPSSFVPAKTLCSRAIQKSLRMSAEEKLVYDAKSGRFYERKLSEICEDEFCLIDSENGDPILLTKEEKERIFLDSIQSYYIKGKANIEDSEFDKLREDLSWEGSALVTLNRNETLFMNAMQAYMKGTPILTDKQFDELKRSLKETNSKIAVSVEPVCYVDTGVCKVTWTPDKLKQASLYIPSSLVASIVWVGGIYELLNLFGASLNPLILLVIGSFPIYVFSKEVTENIIFKDPFIAHGPCPSCGVDNAVFFGDVLGVPGATQESTVVCTNCRSSLTIKKATLRVSTLAPKERE